MTRSVIDPITRIEGHLRVEMEVTNGKVSEAWVSGGCFRGMELVVEDRTPEDAAQIVQRICGVCPVSHAHSSAIAAEKAYGIKISNNARIIRNLLEGAQFLHSHILWFYNLAALDYVNPLNALKADAADALRSRAWLHGTSTNSDFVALKERLPNFADNGQLSIFSGNWFDAEDGTGLQARRPSSTSSARPTTSRRCRCRPRPPRSSRHHRRQDAARHDAHPGRHGVRSHRPRSSTTS